MQINNPGTATIYTDGSCSTQLLIGAWVAIIIAGEKTIQLNDLAFQTTHNRMELTAVIKAIEYIHVHEQEITGIRVCSDSQYVVELNRRKEKLKSTDFITKTGNALQNADLIKRFFELSELYDTEMVKIKAHEKRSEANHYNIEADLQSRKMVREWVSKHHLAISILTFLFLIF